MKNYFLVISQILGLTIFCGSVFSQGIVTANQLTGSADIVIPIATITSGQVSIPITLTYSSGVKSLDFEGTAGIGWWVNAGGQVSREVRGLPDDVTKDIAGNNRIGWMSTSNTSANAISSFSIQNDGGVTCSNEITDNTYISSNFPFNYDTEPDIFNVNAPGLSCQLIYNRSVSKFVPVVNDDLIITSTTDPISGLVNSFTITNDRGIKYVFSICQTVKRTANNEGVPPAFFKIEYQQYEFGINYYSSWYLSNITDPVGNAINLIYTNGSARVSTNPVSLYMPGATAPTLQFDIDQSVIKPVLDHIKTNNVNAVNQKLSFYWQPSSTGQRCVTAISGMGRSYQFTYSSVASSANSNYTRLFLRKFADYGCATPASYQFVYGGETESSGNYTTMLPDSAGVKVDYWGYPVFNSNVSLQPKVWINPVNATYQRYAIYAPVTGGGSYTFSSANGNNRSAELTNFNVGNLTTITYIEGGSTTIIYEPNSYVDVPSSQVVLGGGIRVKQITDHDGNDVGKNIVRTYSYDDPTTGLTSGKPVSLPMFAFTIPYSGAATGSDLWNNNTVLSDYDLSNEDHSILYGHAKVSQTGGGSTLYQYYLPATNWDNSASPGCNGCATEWTPTINRIARTNCSSPYGPVNNSTFAYPFIPNPNYDFERGLLQKVTDFNDAGTKVSETVYTYQRSFIPSTITAFKYDDLPNGALLARAYNKYNINYNTSELTASVTKKVFDSPTLTQAQSSTINYVYGSAKHKLLTKKVVTNSDNTTMVSNIKYVKDYDSSVGADPNVNALYNLGQQNVNSPVETWQEVIRSGVTKTVSANLTMFDAFIQGSNTLYLPCRQLRFVSPGGVTSFAPFSVSGQTATFDAKYIPIANYLSYDNTGAQQTVDDASRNVKTVIIDHSTNNPTATFRNAAYSEIGFSDFDTDPLSPQTSSFGISGTSTLVASSSHTGNAYGLGTGQTVSKVISARNMKVSNYIFSIWINAATAGTLNFTLSSGAITTFTKSFAVGGWTYYEWKLPVSSMTSSFTISFTSSQSISIDDLLFYPDIARVNTASYNPQTGYLVAETNTNGVSTYYTKDKWGRLLFQLDQDKNIIKKTSYFNPAELSLSLLTPTVGNDPVQALMATIFTANASECLAGVTYTWDFGDGTPLVTVYGDNAQSHIYNNTGDYTITVTASHPSLGTKSSTNAITVTSPPIAVEICRSGVRSWNNCTESAVAIDNCGSNPSDEENTYFTVTSAVPVFGTLTYTWQISFNNGSTWTNTGSNLPQFSRPCSGGSVVAYMVRCNVTTTSGQNGTSDSLSLFAPPCLR